jgi:hypothetical protein
MNHLSDQEALHLTGGLVAETILVGVTLAVISCIINNWDSFKAGLMGQPDPSVKKSTQ